LKAMACGRHLWTTLDNVAIVIAVHQWRYCHQSN
jgi:hypothetical protein